MLYFFHHYELPAILQQERIQQIVTNQQNNQQGQTGNNVQPDANHNTQQNPATSNTTANGTGNITDSTASNTMGSPGQNLAASNTTEENTHHTTEIATNNSATQSSAAEDQVVVSSQVISQTRVTTEMISGNTPQSNSQQSNTEIGPQAETSRGVKTKWSPEDPSSDQQIRGMDNLYMSHTTSSQNTSQSHSDCENSVNPHRAMQEDSSSVNNGVTLEQCLGVETRDSDFSEEVSSDCRNVVPSSVNSLNNCGGTSEGACSGSGQLAHRLCSTSGGQDSKETDQLDLTGENR